MKKLKMLLFSCIIMLYGCSASIDTTGMSTEDKFKVAKTKFENRDFEEALNDLQALILQNRASAIADDAQYYIGMCRFEKGEYILASNEFSIMIRDYPTSSLVKDAQYMLSNSYYELSPHYSLDQRFTKKAIEELQLFIDYFPAEPRVVDAENKIKELNEKLAEKIYRSGLIYAKMDYKKSAVLYYDELVEKYPDSGFVPDALYKKINILVEKKRNKEALEVIDKFLNKYPKHEYSEELKNIKESISNLVSVK